MSTPKEFQGLNPKLYAKYMLQGHITGNPDKGTCDHIPEELPETSKGFHYPHHSS
jgi:hypothetical protein